MAARYFVNGGVDNNWGTIGNWSLTDGGAGGQTVAGSSDDVHFTANSPNCTVNTSARNALSLDFTGYANTITMSQNITVSGSVTLVPAMGVAGAGTLIVVQAATLTSGGKTWPNPLTISTNSVTGTLADNWTVAGLLTLGSGSANIIINGFQFTCTGGVRFGGTTGSVTGTTVLLLTAAQTIDAPSITTGRGLQLPMTINTAGAITISGATVPLNMGGFTYTAAGSVTSNSVAWPSAGGGGLACNPIGGFLT